VIGFLAVWLLAGLVIGEIGTASTSGAIVGTVVLGLLGVAPRSTRTTSAHPPS